MRGLRLNDRQETDHIKFPNHLPNGGIGTRTTSHQPLPQNEDTDYLTASDVWERHPNAGCPARFLGFCTDTAAMFHVKRLSSNGRFT